MTIDETIEEAALTLFAIRLALGAFLHAMDQIQKGNMLEAHWALWTGGFTKVQPEHDGLNQGITGQPEDMWS